MASPAPWEAFLAEHFPGYLLPEASRRALPVEAAARFLTAVSGEARQLARLRATSVLAPRMDDLAEFALRQLPALLRVLPARTAPVQRSWEGRLEGKLDVRATLARRLGGRPAEFVGRTRERRVNLPENVLLKAVVERLVGVLTEVLALGVSSASGWSAALPACAAALQRALAHEALARVGSPQVPPTPVTFAHEQAAGGARHHAYTLALRFHHALAEGLDSADPERIARVVAAGALGPLAAPTRFELAVLLRLCQALEEAVTRRAPGRWKLARTLIEKDRESVAALCRDDGGSVELFYNQACLDPGPYERGVRRYLGQQGRLRPDITVIARAPGAPPRATVVEAKLSSDPGYLAQGYQEALLYRAEYAAQLTGWPKAILVASASSLGVPHRDDDVIAVGWADWVPADVLEGLLDGL